jgi:hypothetical protein
VKKIYDLAVKNGSYMAGGQEKGRYVNVGAIMENDKGRFAFISAHVNFAAFPRREGSESVIVSLFEPRERDGAAPRSAPAQASAPTPEAFDTDIPF